MVFKFTFAQLSSNNFNPHSARFLDLAWVQGYISNTELTELYWTHETAIPLFYNFVPTLSEQMEMLNVDEKTRGNTDSARLNQRVIHNIGGKSFITPVHSAL